MALWEGGGEAQVEIGVRLADNALPPLHGAEHMQRLRRRTFEVLEIAEDGDRVSRLTDLFLMAMIVLNVLAVLAESIPQLAQVWHDAFHRFELFSLFVFTLEYLMRLWGAVESPDPRFSRLLWGRARYAASPAAIIDLLAIAPFFLMGTSKVDLRILRVLRILRILKLSHYFGALDVLFEVLRRERHAFGAASFLFGLGVVCAASGMYAFEHELQPEAFGSIPEAMWWAVVTLTTVGYGDVTPMTLGGKLFGASVTVLGIGMVALPTGILASGFSAELRRRRHIYAAEVHHALEDGRVDEYESEQLEKLSNRLGLAEDDAALILDESMGPPGPVGRDAATALPRACPHCGGALELNE